MEPSANRQRVRLGLGEGYFAGEAGRVDGRWKRADRARRPSPAEPLSAGAGAYREVNGVRLHAVGDHRLVAQTGLGTRRSEKSGQREDKDEQADANHHGKGTPPGQAVRSGAGRPPVWDALPAPVCVAGHPDRLGYGVSTSVMLELLFARSVTMASPRTFE